MKKILVTTIILSIIFSVSVGNVSAYSNEGVIDTSNPQVDDNEIISNDNLYAQTSLVSRTQAEAVNWAEAQIGKRIDYDGVYGAQCVDLTKAYGAYMGTGAFMGNAKDYATFTVPAGWTRYTSSQTSPQPGDIVIWTDSGYGHVGIVIGDNLTVEQNVTPPYDGSGPVTQKTRNNFQISGKTLYGVLRPTYRNTTNTLGDWVFQKTWGELNIGVWDYYEIEHTLRWIYLDVNTGQWHEIYEGTSNWITLLVDKGSYLVQVEVKDRNGNVLETKVAGTDGGTNTEINATNVTRESNGEYLLGVTSNNPYISFVIKLYNYSTGQWFTQYNNQWARFRPESGVWYRVQFEIYGWGRMLDYKGFDFMG